MKIAEEELIKQHIKKQTDFLKEAFCVDGEVTFYKEVSDFKTKGVMYMLKDSKRGKFYVTISKDN